MKTNFVSLTTLMDRLLRKPYLNNITYEEVIDLTVDFLEIIGVPDIFEEVHYSGRFNNYKLSLPCELTEEIFIYVNGVPAYAASDPRHPYMGDSEFKYPDHRSSYENNMRGVRRSSAGHNGLYTYRVKENILFLNIPHGSVSIIGSRIKVNELGEVMIPEDRLFLLALQYYIIYKKMEDRFLAGQIHRSLLDTVEQEYMWNVGKLEASYKMINYAEAATIFNALHTLRNKKFNFGGSFKNLPTKEIVRIHN